MRALILLMVFTAGLAGTFISPSRTIAARERWLPSGQATAAATAAQSSRFIEAALSLADPRPCIPAPGQRACDVTREALWNGESRAWAARGVTDDYARFNETVLYRVQAGDPLAISNIARILGTPYLKVTHLQFGGANEYAEVTNLGGGAQDVAGWTLRSPGRNALFELPRYSLGPGEQCYLYRGSPGANPGASCRMFTSVTPMDAADVWPDDGGTVRLRADPLGLTADESLYGADLRNQPPPPNLQGVNAIDDGMTASPALRFTLGAARTTYAAGEAVEFQMQLRNTGATAVSLEFSTGQEFDLTVTNEAGLPVWRWAAGRFFTQAFRTITLRPGEQRSFTATWDQRADGGAAVTAGSYQAVAALAGNHGVRSNPITIQIR